MNLTPGKLYLLNGNRVLYADEDCDIVAGGPEIEKDDIVLLLSDVSALYNFYGRNEYNRVKVLSSNGDIGYIFFNKKIQMFSEI